MANLVKNKEHQANVLIMVSLIKVLSDNSTFLIGELHKEKSIGLIQQSMHLTIL